VNGLLPALALAVASAAAYAGAAVLQERLAAQTEAGPVRGRPALFGFLARARWWISVACNGAGGALHVLALAYGSLSVIQPLGALTLVFALPLGAAAAGRRPSPRQWWGAAATIAGLAILLGLTVPGADLVGLDAGEALAVTAVATLVILALALALRASRRPVARSVLAASAAGVAFAVASALTQPLTRQVTEHGVAGLFTPLTVALAGMATAGLLLSQLAYRDSGLGTPLATVTLANPVASAAIAVAVLGERTAGGAWGALAALAGAVVAGWGVVLLAEPDPPVTAGQGAGTRALDGAWLRSGALDPQPAYRGAGAADRSGGPAAAWPAGTGERVSSPALSVGRRIVRPVRRRCETAWRRSWGRRRRRVG
jgi:drug/metabolite transporter (DMT)-like permease